MTALFAELTLREAQAARLEPLASSFVTESLVDGEAHRLGKVSPSLV